MILYNIAIACWSYKRYIDLHINMTIKGPSCKQVIVPMNIDNTRKFIKNSSTHIININKVFKNIKSNVMTKFICIEDKSIVISTDNVASVVATTCRNSTCSMLTSAKLSNGLSHSGDYKRTRQGALAAFIYYIYTWLLVRATTISIWPLSPCCYLMSYYSSTCVFHKATMLSTCVLTSYL